MAIIKKTSPARQDVDVIPPKKGTALAVKSRNDPFADAGMGAENVSAKDLIIPRLTLLHEMSKVTKKSRPEYIKGAAGGMYCIPSLQKLWEGDEGVYAVPVSFRRRLIEWYPVDDGGGLVQMDVPEDRLEDLEMKNAGVYLSKDKDGKDTEIVITPEYYLLLVDLETGRTTPAVMTLTGKKAAVARRWNTLIMSQRRINPKNGNEVVMPFWFNIYHLGVTAASNDKGDYYLPNVTVFSETLDADHGNSIYAAAKDFYHAVAEGKAKAADLDIDEA